MIARLAVWLLMVSAIVSVCNPFGFAFGDEAELERTATEGTTGAASTSASAEFREGWRSEISVPDVRGDGSEILLHGGRLLLWVEQGWLLVKRETTAGDLEWQVVLARVQMPCEMPQVTIAKPDNRVRVTFGSYFVREDLGWLRVLREEKSSESPDWPELAVDPARKTLGAAGIAPCISAWESDGWCWVESGLKKKPDVCVRLQHTYFADTGYDCVRMGATVRFSYGGGTCADDDASLFCVARTPMLLTLASVASVRAKRELKDGLRNRKAPDWSVKQWVNSAAPLSLSDLGNKVVLIDFWGVWCGPCVAKLPATEALHQKYKDQGLVVIGIHSSEGSDGIEEVVRDKKVSFAIAIDNGETAKAYGIDGWPTYFLIDKTGKVNWGLSTELPSEELIEELLK